MKILQDEGGFTNEEKLSFRDQIYNNCVSQMRTMIEAAITIRHPLSKKRVYRVCTKDYQNNQ